MKVKAAILAVALGLTTLVLSQSREQFSMNHKVATSQATRTHVQLVVGKLAADATLEPYLLSVGVFDPGHTGTIVSQWVKHLGLMDPGETDNANWGLLMSKDTVNATDASAVGQVVINNKAHSKNLQIMNLTELGYDIRHGSHCGAGSPRFNVIDTNGGFHFVGGCANGVLTPNIAPGWDRVRFDPTSSADAFPPIPAGTPIRNIFLIVDEGIDAGPDFSGVDILDNIDVNGALIGEPN